MKDNNYYMEKIVNYLETRCDWNRAKAVVTLCEFEDTHGSKAIIAMYGFIRYAAMNKLEEDKVVATLYHDLNGAKDKLLLPKTISYRGFAEE